MEIKKPWLFWKNRITIAFFGARAAAWPTEPVLFNAPHTPFGRGLLKARNLGTTRRKAARESTRETFGLKKKLTDKKSCMNTIFP